MGINEDAEVFFGKNGLRMLIAELRSRQVGMDAFGCKCYVYSRSKSSELLPFDNKHDGVLGWLRV